MNKALTNLNDGQKKPPHHVGEDRDGEEIQPVTLWNKRIYSINRLHVDYTSITKLGFTPSSSLTLVWKRLSNQTLVIYPEGDLL
ncbi:hypothetical protein ACE3II_16105 [Enterobacter hormaechei subsp. steigerwaltii]